MAQTHRFHCWSPGSVPGPGTKISKATQAADSEGGREGVGTASRCRDWLASPATLPSEDAEPSLGTMMGAMMSSSAWFHAF